MQKEKRKQTRKIKYDKNEIGKEIKNKKSKKRKEKKKRNKERSLCNGYMFIIQVKIYEKNCNCRQLENEYATK